MEIGKKLDDLQVYRLSLEIGESIWRIVARWSYFERDTIGKQLVRAADSIAANLSEGYGRFHYKENKQFCYYCRGSIFETVTWINKARRRGLVSEDEYIDILQKLRSLTIKVNRYIQSIGRESGKTPEHFPG